MRWAKFVNFVFGLDEGYAISRDRLYPYAITITSSLERELRQASKI